MSLTADVRQLIDQEWLCTAEGQRKAEAVLARVEAAASLLQEALVWAPRRPTYPPEGGRTQAKGKGWVDLGNRIEAFLKENAPE